MSDLSRPLCQAKWTVRMRSPCAEGDLYDDSRRLVRREARTVLEADFSFRTRCLVGPSGRMPSALCERRTLAAKRRTLAAKRRQPCLFPGRSSRKAEGPHRAENRLPRSPAIRATSHRDTGNVPTTEPLPRSFGRFFLYWFLAPFAEESGAWSTLTLDEEPLIITRLLA